MEKFSLRISKILSHVKNGGLNETEEGDSLQVLPTLNGSLPVIIGAMILDIHCEPFDKKKFQPGTTIPGKIAFKHGGVARNVSECLSVLNVSSFIITAIGNDVAGDSLIAKWQSLNLPTHGIRRCNKIHTPIVNAIFDNDGEIMYGVADVLGLEEELTFEWISKFSKEISMAPFVFFDANILPSTIHSLCNYINQFNVPIFFEPTSISKSIRATSALSMIDFISPNESELIAMADAVIKNKYKNKNKIQNNNKNKVNELNDINELNKLYKINNTQNPSPFSSKLLSKIKKLKNPILILLLLSKIKNIFITIGEEGVLFCKTYDINAKEKKENNNHHQNHVNNNQNNNQNNNNNNQSKSIQIIHFPASPVNQIVSLSGAGDCLVGGILGSLCKGKDLTYAIASGIALAKQSIQCSLNIPPVVDLSLLNEDAWKCLKSCQLVNISNDF